MKKLFYLYQKCMWYKSIAYQEIQKPLDYLTAFLALLTFLKVYGISISIGWAMTAYAAFMLIMIGIGKVLVLMNIPAYVQKLNNSQNSELQEILTILKTDVR